MRGGGNHIRRLLRWAAWLGVAVSVAVGGYAAWRYFDPLAAARQSAARVELRQDWQAGRVAVVPGRPFALMRIPRLWGPEGAFTVLEGVTDRSLSIGPAHFSGTALPGEVGNFAVAGHTVGGGDPFLHLSTLRTGDEIVIDMRDEEDVYTVSRAPFVVKADNVGILAPVPDLPGGIPAVARITIVSCVWPEHADDSREVVEGTLTEEHRRDAP